MQLHKDTEKNADFVMVMVDTNDKRDDLDAFLKSSGGEGMVNIHDEGGTFSTAWGVQGFPSSFIIDENGLVHAANYFDAGVREHLKDFAVRKKAQAGKK